MNNPFKGIAEGMLDLLKPKKPDEDQHDITLVLNEKAFLANGPAPAESQVDKTLNERGSRYGTFQDNSVIYVRLMQTFAESPNWESSPPEVKHALGNIATKLARLLTGDVMYFDNWRDIAGYATLMDKICQGEKR